MFIIINIIIIIIDLLTVIPHTPSPEKIMCDKKDGQWYTHDGVDIKETQQRNSKYLWYQNNFLHFSKIND